MYVLIAVYYSRKDKRWDAWYRLSMFSQVELQDISRSVLHSQVKRYSLTYREFATSVHARLLISCNHIHQQIIMANLHFCKNAWNNHRKILTGKLSYRMHKPLITSVTWCYNSCHARTRFSNPRVSILHVLPSLPLLPNKFMQTHPPPRQVCCTPTTTCHTTSANQLKLDYHNVISF